MAHRRDTAGGLVRLGQAGGKRLDVLGGRTLKENHAWWLDRERRGANGGWGTRNGPGPNYVQPRPRPDDLPPETADPSEALRLHLTRCGVPDRVAEVLTAGPDERDAVTVVRHWWGLGQPLLLLHGTTGGGKTVAACTAFLRMRRTVRWEGGAAEDWDSAGCEFVTAGELARGSYFGPEAAEARRHLERVTLLVVDDLGAELMSDGWASNLTELVTHREARAHARTVLTTNVGCRPVAHGRPSPFEARYGSRVARRIRESGAVVHVDPEPDRRANGSHLLTSEGA